MLEQSQKDDLGLTSAEIASIDCYLVRMPLRKPLVMSTYRIDDGPSLFLRIRSTDGAEGWGEAPANPVMSGETLPGMKTIIETYMKPRLIGAVRRQVRPLWLVGGSGQPEKDVEDAIGLRRQGFTAFKLKVGVAPIETEIRCIKMLREALGDEVLIAADANMAWDVATAIRFVRAVAQYGVAFLEQPTRAGDVSRMAAVAVASPIPIGADESIHSVGDLLAHDRANAIGGASLKTIKLGGVSAVVNCSHLCDALGLSINLAMLMESSLATAAMVHAACAVPQVDWGLSLGHLWLAEDPVEQPLVCVDGQIDCPRGPGLGIKVDERRLAALAC